MLVDLHILVSEADPDALVEAIKNSSLDGVCLVDIDRLPPVDLVEQVEATGKTVFRGIQVTLSRGHILAFPPYTDFDFQAIKSAAEDDDQVVRGLITEGCALVACHPYDKSTPAALGDWIIQLRGLNGVIAVNGKSKTTANDLALEVVENLDLPATGGTGGHEPIGKAATLFTTTPANQKELAEELRRSDCWAVALGDDDRWSESEGRPERGRSGRDRGGRDRGRGSRDRGRGGRDRGDRSRGGRGDRGRSSRDRGRGGRDRGSRDGDRGGRDGDRGDRGNR